MGEDMAIKKIDELTKQIEEQMQNMPSETIKKSANAMAKDLMDKAKTMQSRNVKTNPVLTKKNIQSGIDHQKIGQIIAYYAVTHNFKKTGMEFGVNLETVQELIEEYPELYKKFERIKNASLAETLANIVKSAGAEIARRLTVLPEELKTYDLNTLFGTAIDKLWRLEGRPDRIIKFEQVDDIKTIISQLEEDFINESEFTNREEIEAASVAALEAPKD